MGSQSYSELPIEQSRNGVAVNGHHSAASDSSCNGTDANAAAATKVASTSASAQLEYPPSTPHLNLHNLLILSSHPSRGRGVYASKPLRAGTVVEISPVLLFSKEEWENHGSKTILDCYTFKWGRMGEMALALGLGSLFNHSATPSVSFRLDRSAHCITYTLMSDVVAGEELCISYGPWGKQYETPAPFVESDSDESTHLAEFMKIGQDREDSDEEAPADGQRRLIVRRTTRTRHNPNGSTSFGRLSPSGTGSGSDSGFEPIPRWSRLAETSMLQRSSSSSASSHKSEPNGSNGTASQLSTRLASASIQSSAGSSIASSAPIWRLSSLTDPTTVPIQLLSCYALLIDKKKSSEVFRLLDRRALDLGRAEDDSLNHTKRLAHFSEDPEKRRALLCLTSQISRPELLRLLKEEGLLPADDSETNRLLEVSVASTPAPIQTRLAEWSAPWPLGQKGNKTAAKGSKSMPSTDSGDCTPADLQGEPGVRPGFIDRSADKAFWSEARTQWVIKKLARCVLLAEVARQEGQLPIGVHVCPSIAASTGSSTGGGNNGSGCSTPTAGGSSSYWNADGVPLPGGEAIEVDAYDSRIAQKNPIKHAVVNAVQKVAELRAFRRNKSGHSNEVAPRGRSLADDDSAPISISSTISESNGTASSSTTHDRIASPSPSGNNTQATTSDEPLSLNGKDYLLTSLTLFTTHEPCVYCCMSLVHSRVRTLIFLEKSPGSGGCCGSLLPKGKRCDRGLEEVEDREEDEEGGPYAIQEQRGLNHRFEVWKWRGGREAIEKEVARLKEIGEGGGGESRVGGGIKSLLDLRQWGMVDP